MENQRERVIGYVRVSSLRQEDNPRYNHQESSIRAYADRKGWDVEIIKETRSGKNINKRPILLNALKRLERGEATKLITYTVDRLTRNVDDGAFILNKSEQEGWDIWPLDLPPENLPREFWVKQFRNRIVDAHYELDVLSVRTKEGLRNSINKDRLGSRRLPTYSPEVLHRVEYLRKKRKLTFERIAEHLNREGYPITRPDSASIHEWTKSKVQGACRKLNI